MKTKNRTKKTSKPKTATPASKRGRPPEPRTLPEIVRRAFERVLGGAQR